MIGLLDCNNFFVSCQRLFRPDLEGKPVAVLSSNDGCIVARSQEVKDLGIAMGVPYFQVKDICTQHNVVLFSGNLTLYRDISARVMQVLEDTVGNIEVYSIDEAFFSLSESTSVEDIRKIRDRVMHDVGVPVSVGVASTKTLAKQASSIGKKEDGAYLLTYEEWSERSKRVKCGTVWGMGKQTVAKLHSLGIDMVGDFMSLPLEQIRTHFGVAGERMYQELQGTPVSFVEPYKGTEQKSIMSTASFAQTTTELLDMESAIAKHVTHVAGKLRDARLLCGAITIYLNTDRYGDFFMQGSSAEVMLPEPTSDTSVLLKYALTEVRKMFTQRVPYKKAGVLVSLLIPKEHKTQSLFSEPETYVPMDEITDTINKRFGRHTVHIASMLDMQSQTKSNRRSPFYTTVWKDIPTVKAK